MSGERRSFVIPVEPVLHEQASLNSAFTSATARDIGAKKDGKTTVHIGLHILYASWNRPCCLVPHDELLQAKMCQNMPLTLLGGGDNTTVTASSSVIRVDESDEALDLLVGDSTCCSSASTIPCPPENLPALAVVMNRSCGTSEGQSGDAVIRYLSCLDSKELMDYLGNHRDECLPSKVVQEIQDIFHEVILDTGTLRSQQTLKKTVNKLHQYPSQGESLRIFVAGDRMSVGKTSVCLGLLGTLVNKFNYKSHEVAYIKPATQNENPQLVQRYCESLGIECVSVGPIVYYRGFTRAFLAGDTESTEELLSKVEIEVDRVAKGKRVVLVDGVGFPAVGSICGTDNASVARASGYPPTTARGGVRLPMGVILIGGPGVGSAVDAFNLNATYFEKQNVPVLGAIYNKLELDGFYSLENCKAQITSYFDQNRYQQKLGRRPFGFVPLFAGIAGGGSHDPLDHVDEFLEIFSSHVDVASILEAAAIVQRNELPLYGMSVGDYHDSPLFDNYNNCNNCSSGSSNNNSNSMIGHPPTKRLKLSNNIETVGISAPTSAVTLAVAQRTKRTRDEIEGRAIQAGAAPSA